MRLDDVLDTCRGFEERAAAVYHAFAAATREPRLRALWETMESEEREHARGIAGARWTLPATLGWQTRLDGWDEAIAEIGARLAAAEDLPPQASDDERLAASLAIEGTELEVVRRAALDTTGRRGRWEPDTEHLERLADTALACSSDAHVGLQATLLRAHLRLRSSTAAGHSG